MSKNLDEFVSNIKENEYPADDVFKRNVLKKTMKKIKFKKRYNLASQIAAIFLAIVMISALIPNTPVNAFFRKTFSFIPGIGVVENDSYDNRIVSVLKDDVTVRIGNEYITINSAYIQNDWLIVHLKTNVGLGNSNALGNKELLKFYAGELNPEIYLVYKNDMLKPQGKQTAGASLTDGTYSIQAQYQLPEGLLNKNEFTFAMEDFDQNIKIVMYELDGAGDIEDMGKHAIVGEIVVFADVERQTDTVRIMLSAVAPKGYRNIRFSNREIEKELFSSEIHVIDAEGTIYLRNVEMAKENGANVNTFYFSIPENAQGLKLIIPQVMYEKQITELYKFKLPGNNEKLYINKKYSTGENDIILKELEKLPAGSDLVPEEFRAFDSLKLDMEAINTSNSGKEIICRIIPSYKIKNNIIHDYMMTSQSTRADVWGLEIQSGYTISVIDDIDSIKNIALELEVECAYLQNTTIILE